MRWPQKGTKCRWEEGRGTLGGGQTFHGHAGRGVDAALGVAHAAEIVTCVLLTHALDAQPLVRVSQVDSCKQPVEVRVQMGLGPWPHEPPHLAFRPRPALPDSFSSSLLSLYHTMLGTCAPATGHRISRESLTFTKRSVKFCVSRGASRAGGGVERELSGMPKVKWRQGGWWHWEGTLQRAEGRTDCAEAERRDKV